MKKSNLKGLRIIAGLFKVYSVITLFSALGITMAIVFDNASLISVIITSAILIEAQKSPVFKLGMSTKKLWRDLAKKSLIFGGNAQRLSRRVLGNYLKRISQHFTSREQPEKPRALARGGSFKILKQYF